MILFLICINSYELDLIVNKKILIHSIPYSNFILAENISDFSKNIFHTKNSNYNLKEYNKISRLEKFNDKYKIKIGNYYVCQNPNMICNYNSENKICKDAKFNEIDCDVCKNKSIESCDTDIDLWNIEKTYLGYIIRRKDVCFTLGFKLFLDTCKDSKNQLFGFEDYELLSCIENFNPNKKPETNKELIDSIKMKQNLKNLKKVDPEKFNKVSEDIEKQKNVDKALEEIIPGIKNKKKMKKLWSKLWNYGFGGYHWPNGFKFKMFCAKWW
ncbi:hypothetical protein P3W45_001220 [Vairimorpha bombi]|jgi:mRNA-degrading endonuclease RelE of RelBE toxin-antitoxin system